MKFNFWLVWLVVKITKFLFVSVLSYGYVLWRTILHSFGKARSFLHTWYQDLSLALRTQKFKQVGFCLGSTPSTPAGCASGYVGRRRTDLMPTIPTRDPPYVASRKSLNHSPGRAYSMTRLDQLAKPRKRPDLLPAVVETMHSNNTFRPLSSPRQSSVTRSMSHLAVGKQSGQPTNRKPLSKADSRSMHLLSVDGPTIAPRMTRATQLRQQKLLASTTNGNDGGTSFGPVVFSFF